MARESCSGRMVPRLKGLFLKVKRMVTARKPLMVSLLGEVNSTKESFYLASKSRSLELFTMVNSQKVKGTGVVASIGQMATIMRESSTKARFMAMACSEDQAKPLCLLGLGVRLIKDLYSRVTSEMMFQ